jgi:hypothetical protein
VSSISHIQGNSESSAREQDEPGKTGLPAEHASSRGAGPKKYSYEKNTTGTQTTLAGICPLFLSIAISDNLARTMPAAAARLTSDNTFQTVSNRSESLHSARYRREV